MGGPTAGVGVTVLISVVGAVRIADKSVGAPSGA